MSYAAWVWLLSCTVANCTPSSVIQLFSIQHDTKFPNIHKSKVMIFQFWTTSRGIWTSPRQLWLVWNFHSFQMIRTRPIICRCTSMAPSVAWKQFIHSGIIFKLFSNRALSLRTWETVYQLCNEYCPSSCRTTETWCHRNCRHVPFAKHFLQWTQCRWWEQ